ncbi:MAG: DUF933 domain-containing protein [Candidatus Omnitrophica bacterium]|nr:DUF933 domain-containing protein [Candidatus Omnitrophota bacterium]
MVAANASTDLVLKDLEFVETRLGRATTEEEKALLLKLKGVLEGEQFIARANLNDAEKQALAGYTLFTVKPIVIVDQQMLADPQGLLAKALADSGYISFFTTGEKETRAWLIRKGTTAHEAAGAIHTDIQRGFIRAEIISLNDFLSCGGETQAKQAGKLRSEQKEYIMQDADLVNFRFNK